MSDALLAAKFQQMNSMFATYAGLIISLRSCTNFALSYPQVIEIYFHLHSYLHIQSAASSEKRAWKGCKFCYGDKKGLYKFCCDECDFDICWACSKSLLKYHEGGNYVQHFKHSHPLTLMMVNKIDCLLCVDVEIWSLLPWVGSLANTWISLISKVSDVLYPAFIEKCQRSPIIFPTKTIRCSSQ